MPIKLDAEIKLGANKIDAATEVLDLVITSELDSPDSCAITFTKTGADKWGPVLKLTDSFTVKLAHSGDDIDFAFVGEITGFEPSLGPRQTKTATEVVRGLSAMHSLSRGKQSYAYVREDRSLNDRTIFDDLLKRRSQPTITLEDDPGDQSSPPKVSYYHVMQHNQTDLEFLRHRAARIGCYILVRDDKLIFRKRAAKPSGLKLMFGNDKDLVIGDDKKQPVLAHFTPRVSSANQVTQVEVRCWAPDQKQELVCVAPTTGSAWPKLGDETGTDATKEKHADAIAVRVDVPFGSKEEGDAIAMAILNERLLDYVTAEGSVPGDPRLKPGMVIEVQTTRQRFDGLYFITQVRHSYNSSHTPFRTDFRASRDAIAKPTDKTT